MAGEPNVSAGDGYSYLIDDGGEYLVDDSGSFVVSEAPIAAADSISGGQFSRGQWRGIKEQEHTRKEAVERAQRLKKKRLREAALKAAREVAFALNSKRKQEDRHNLAAADLRALEAAQAALMGAQQAQGSLGQDAALATALQAALARAAANDDEEAIMLLLAA